jgi:DNA-binding beta-propeller fold protein YncE
MLAFFPTFIRKPEGWGMLGARIVRILVCSLTLTALMAFSALCCGASAAISHPFIESITQANGKPLVQPWGMSFDSSGNLYVADPQSRVVDKFSSANAYLSQIGTFPEKFVRDVAVDDATGVVYATESGAEQVYVYKPNGSGGYELKQKVKTGGYMYISVDNSSGPRKNDVYVFETEIKVRVFETNASGELITTPPIPELTPPPGGFSLLGYPYEHQGIFGNGALTVDAGSGKAYVAEPPHKAVSEYGPEGTFQTKLTGTETPAGSFEPTGVAVDQANGDLFVLDTAHKVLDEFSSTGAYVGQITGPSGSEGFSTPLGVAVQNFAGPTQGDIYVSDGGNIDVFGPAAAATVESPLAVAKAGTGKGAVTGSGVNCGGTCTAEVEEGTQVSLTATPEAGSEFVGWSGEQCAGSTNAECKFTMPGHEVDVTAEFKLEEAAHPKFAVNLAKTGTGDVIGSGLSCGLTCTAEVEEGSQATLIATPEAGSEFVEWSGEECAGSTSTE